MEEPKEKIKIGQPVEASKMPTQEELFATLPAIERAWQMAWKRHLEANFAHKKFPALTMRYLMSGFEAGFKASLKVEKKK